MSILRISLFGTVRIIHDYWPGEVKIAPKAQAVLAYLLLRGPRRYPRDQLVDLFWRDQTPSRGRSCLSTTLWRLKSALEPADVRPGTYLITTAGDEIGFNWDSDYWLDVGTFEKQSNHVLSQPIRALQVADIHNLEETLKLYTGDLLEGFYDDWVFREQERFRTLYLNSLEYLMNYYQSHGFYAMSIWAGQKILACEPAHEAIHRELMRLYAKSGQRTLALKQYKTCCEVLAQELDLPPMEETQTLYSQIMDQAPGQSAVYLNSVDLQHISKQLNQARNEFNDAQKQFKLVKQHLDEAQWQLQRILNQLGHRK